MRTHRGTHRTRRARTGHAPRGERAARPRTLRPLEVAVFAAIALAFVAVSCLPTPADGAPQATSTRMVRVETSDSLWSIAREHAGKGMSVPATVEAIRRLNRMEGSDQLHPGTFVAVPCPHAIDAVFALR